MGSVTQILNQGSLNTALHDKALQELLYHELKVIAKSKISKNFRDNSLNTTTLVHDAFIKINDKSEQKQWHSRRHFYATASLVMQQIIVDSARKRLADKRGGNNSDMTFDDNQIQVQQQCSELVALSDALEKLKNISPDMVELVNLRYFVGLTIEEIAEILNKSKRTIDRQWLKTRALLQMWI